MGAFSVKASSIRTPVQTGLSDASVDLMMNDDLGDLLELRMPRSSLCQLDPVTARLIP